MRAEIIEVRGADGPPPYVVRWLRTDTVATVYPIADVDARAVRLVEKGRTPS